MARWDETTTLKFVEIYREQECLWNTKQSLYKNRYARATATEKIIKHMDIADFGAAEVKNKIKNLRSTYVQELTKIKKSQHSGAGTDDVYTPKMKWFYVMKAFLAGIDRKRNSYNNLDENEEDNIEENSPQEDNENENKDNEEGKIQEENEVCKSTKETRSTDAKRLKITKSKIRQVTSCVSDLKSLASSLNSESMEENEFHIFGRHVAAQLEKLPLSAALYAQGEIQGILTRYRLQNVSGPSSASTNSPFLSPSESPYSGLSNDGLNSQSNVLSVAIANSLLDDAAYYDNNSNN